MRISDETTLKEARDRLRELSSQGAQCPCCRQFVKVYRRKLNSGMSLWLIRFYNAGGRDSEYHDAIRITARGAGDWSLLAHWGLIKPDPNRPGYWRITMRGISFVLNRIVVESHAVLYAGRLLRLDGVPIGITKSLGRKFQYHELMRERPTSDEPE